MVQHTYLRHIYANKQNESFSVAWSSVFIMRSLVISIQKNAAFLMHVYIKNSNINLYEYM